MKKILVVMMSLSLLGCGLGLVNALSIQGGYERQAGLRYAPHERGLLDVYVPDDLAAGEQRPVVVWYYGGSWQDGARGQYRFAAEAFLAEGFVVVVPDYRLYPQVKAPAFVVDGAQALAWVQANIADYGGDARNIFVAGHSAGAHIAMSLIYDADFIEAAGGSPDGIAGGIGLAGPYDFLPAREQWLQDVFGTGPGADRHDPITHVDGDEPPVLLLHGAEDKTVGRHNPVNLQKAVRDAGGTAEMKIYPGVSHVRILLALARPLRGKPPVLEDSAAFIRANLR